MDEQHGNVVRISHGRKFLYLGDHRKASKCHERDFKGEINIGNRAGKGRTYGKVGNAYQSPGDYRKAIEYDEKDLKNRPFATNDHMVHGGGQAHYYSRTGTSKQRDLNQ